MRHFPSPTRHHSRLNPLIGLAGRARLSQLSNPLHLNPPSSPLQIYVPRLPGIPNDYPYYPDAFRLAYEDVWLTTSDGLRLHAWLMWPPHWGPEERRRRPTVVFFQENAGNMAFR